MADLRARRARRARPLPRYVSQRIPLFHPDLPVILMWSQKSGCTTVAKWFFDQVGLLDEALAHSSWVHRYEQEVYKRQPRYRRAVESALGSGAYEVVKVVRDPAVRAASAFLVLAEPGALKSHHWAHGHWDIVDGWLAERGRSREDGISFVEHLEMLEARGANGEHINHHLTPQHVPGEEAVVQKTVRIEDFEAWAADFCERHGRRPTDFARIAASHHHHTVTEDWASRLGEAPETYRFRQGECSDMRFPSARALLNERSLPAVRRYYGADMRRYGELYPLPA
jgi:hypothetical protein